LPAPSVSGVLIIDKPCGPTSHDVVARVRKVVKSRQVGHAGTLDPMATGVLVVAIGEATKLVPWLTAASKEYETTIRLGIETDTLDAQGKETSRVPIPAHVRADLRRAIDEAVLGERARTEQSPPAYSAIKIDGQRAHDLARSGKLEADAELPARSIQVLALEVLEIVEGDSAIDLKVRVEASKGYFVRSLARDLARALGTVGHLTALRRTRSGTFDVKNAVTLETIEPSKIVGTTEAASSSLPVTKLDEAGVRAAFHGQRVAPTSMSASIIGAAGPSAWLDTATGELVAVGECDEEGFGRVIRGFPRQ